MKSRSKFLRGLFSIIVLVGWLAACSAGSPNEPAQASMQQASQTVSASASAAGTAAATSTQQSPAETPAPYLPLKGKVILVDAGHGGIDSGTYTSYASCGLKPPKGAHSVGIEEKDITLSIAMKLRDDLEALGATVYMTRETDVKVENDMKVDMQADISLTPRGKREHAAHRPADLAIAVHVNSVGDRSFDDIEVYSYYKPGLGLSRAVVSSMARELGRHVRSIHPMDFAVIDHNPSVATILVETGYLTHPSTCRDLVSDAYQDRLASSIADGVVDFFGPAATH